MSAVLITGMSGAGKSTIAEVLARRGLTSIDADGDPSLARSVDSDGNVVDDPSVPDFAWLARHSWAWDPARLDVLIRAAAPATLYVCGGAANELELADRFTRVFLLEMDEPTMLARLDAPSRDNEWGRIGDTREHLRRRLPGHQDRLRAFGAIPHRHKAAPRPGGGRDTLLHVGQLRHEPRHQAGQSARSMTRHRFHGDQACFEVVARFIADRFPECAVRPGRSRRPGNADPDTP